MSQSFRRACTTALLGLLLAANMSFAQNIAMTSGFSGAWFDPDHSGQGFIVQVLEREAGPVALVYFFTYDISGDPLWLFGIDPIVDNRVDVALREPVLTDFGDGTGDIPPPDLIDWGTLRLSFDDCGTGMAEVVRREKIQVRSGTLRLSRLAGIAAKTCTGGRSDDIRPEDPARGFKRFLSADNVFGVVNYEQRPGEATLSIGIKQAPDGDYPTTIDGKLIGNLAVRDSLGELRLHSPAQENEQLLTVNPIGGELVVADGEGTAIVSATLPATIADLSAGGAPPPFGNERIQAVTKVNAEDIVVADASAADVVIAEGALNRRNESVTFSVELTGAEPALYDVVVDGLVRGRIPVATAGRNQSYGRVDFRFPLAPGSEPLTFDPRGSQIEIRQADSFISGINAATTVTFQLPRQGETPSERLFIPNTKHPDTKDLSIKDAVGR